MQKLWKKSSRHMAIPVFILALVLMASQLMQVHADRDLGIFYLKDHEGDPSALADVTISGELGDGFHKTFFKLADGNVTTDTEVFDPPRTIWYDSQTPDKLKGSIKYEVMPIEPISISYQDREDLYDYKTATIKPPFIEYNDKHQIRNGGHSLTNYGEYGLALIGNQVFAVVPSTKSYTGKSGIYKLHFVDSHSNQEEIPESEALATFSLDKNKGTGSSEIQVLGLEAVGDKLALVLEEDQKLVIRSYDSVSGKLLGEAGVNGFSIPGSDKAVKGRSFYESYEAYADNDSGRLSLAFMSSPDQGIVHKMIWSFDLTSGVRLLNETAVDYKDDMESNLRNMKSINYLNGKLYVTYQSTETKTESDILFDIARPKHLMIRVYEASKLLYEGELITDRNQDSNRVVHLSTGYGYDPTFYREFDHILIRPAK